MSIAASRDPAPPEPVRTADAPRNGALDEQRRSFLRMVSHELRTPLNSILGFSEILTTQLFGPLGDERYQQYAAVIRESGEKLLKLVNQLVEIVRLDGGDAYLDLASEPVEPVIADLLEDLQGEIAARDLRVTCTVPPEAVALADARALRVVLGGLLSNAVAFSPAGGAIRIEGEISEATVDLTVGNDGEGFDPAELPRLLRPFEQGESALTRRSEGAGLGLAICDLACRAMSGKLTLSSAPGQGFTARVSLPSA